MILIRGNDEDVSSRRVIDFLIQREVDYLKVNSDNTINGVTVTLNDNGQTVLINFGQKSIRSDQVKAYYYRRGRFKFSANKFSQSSISLEDDKIHSYLIGEALSTDYLLNSILENTPIKVGAFSKTFLEKTNQLIAATKCDISIPSTHICTTKCDLIHLVEKYKKVATKGIQSNFSVLNKEDGQWYSMYTSIIDKTNLNEISASFTPTLFQEYIGKKYELRIFYLHGKSYAMAIFSQANEKTKIDFRRYDSLKPSRTVPYKLPEEIDRKIDNLMHALGLTTGSLDFIVTSEGKYVFLEVNPDGQFGMVSHPCNYFLERAIADILTQSA